MAFAIRMTQTGGPDVLLTEPVHTEALAPHEAWIVQEAVGVNYLDAMQRQGTAPVPFPGGIGLEAAGKGNVPTPRSG
jgi:NADPH2:quinone reductase